MKHNISNLFALTALFLGLVAQNASADFMGHRLGAGLGVAQIGDSKHTYLAASAEYEYRLHPLLGVGTTVNSVFSDPMFLLVAAPQVFFHPLAGSWYISASPLFQTGGGQGTHIGSRVGTRLPISLGILSIIPQANIDFINGGRNLMFGLGVSI